MNNQKSRDNGREKTHKGPPPKKKTTQKTHRDSPRLTETHRDSTEAPPRGATKTHRDSPRLTETVWDLLDGFSFFCCCFWGWQGFLLSFVSVSGLICHCLGRLGLKSLCFCHLKQ